MFIPVPGIFHESVSHTRAGLTEWGIGVCMFAFVNVVAYLNELILLSKSEKMFGITIIIITSCGTRAAHGFPHLSYSLSTRFSQGFV